MLKIPEELQQALIYQGHGLLDPAARIYQAILTRDPSCVNALHGLGIILVQQRQLDRAIELLERAATLWPQAAVIHADLGKAYQAAGKSDRAEGCFRLALRYHPHSVDLLEQLGLILFSQGKLPAAAEQFRQALRKQPERAGTHNFLAAALQHSGEPHQALTHFRRAVQLDPGLAEAHSNLGNLLLAMNVPQQALFHCKEAVRLRPDIAGAHLNLGNVLRFLGRFPEAKAEFTETIRLAPDLALSYNNMGQVLQDQGLITEAVHWYRQAVQRDPASAEFRIHLVEALIELEQFEEALAQCQTVLARDPCCAEAHNALGLLHIAQGRFDEAVQCFRTAIRWKPDGATAHANLGDVLQELGEFEPALASRRTALRINPKIASELAQIATMLRDRLPEGELTMLRQMLQSPDVQDKDRSALHFGLAHVLDARRDFAGAARHLEQANALQVAVLRQRGSGYDPAEHSASVDALIQAFSPSYFDRVRGFGLETEVPVFIIGLPRSGTTLVEQILASHTRVFGAGELNLAPRSYDGLPALLNRTDPPLACLPQLDAAAATTLAQRHLAGLRARAASAARIIDKLPDNYLLLGWLVTLFPRARIIHCRRNLCDVALSCWMRNFAWVNWASEPQSIVRRIKDYRRTMAHWSAVLPMPIQDVSYEELVADLEGVSRRLIAFCGLEWEPNCLEFYRTRRAVTSASMLQVRQPIYTTSIGRWKNYEPFLQTMFTPLNEMMASDRLVGTS